MVRTLRVMIFNIHANVGTDVRYDLGRIARIVNVQQPDLVLVDHGIDPAHLGPRGGRGGGRSE